VTPEQKAELVLMTATATQSSFLSCTEVAALVLSAEELKTHGELSRRLRELSEQRGELKLYGVGERDWNRRTPQMLRNRAAKIEAKRKPRPSPPHPSPPLRSKADDAFGVLRVMIRVLEREVAERSDALNHPDALRHMAEVLEAKIAHRDWQEQRQKEQRDRDWQEQLRREREFNEWMRGGRLRANAGPLDVLNLRADATSDEINARYRQLAKRLHPDTNRGSEAANGLLRQVTDAMDALRRQGRAR
jgi:hypothetical protein